MLKRGFTLIELLVVIAIIAILAAVLFPVFARAKEKAHQTTCISNLKQQGAAMNLYLIDADDHLPDRRDLKSSLPNGYRPWTTWPPSDPRAGWAAETLHPYTRDSKIWECHSAGQLFGRADQVVQYNAVGQTNYWMWRFDSIADPVPPDNLWGKTPDQAATDLANLNDPFIGKVEGVADVELAVDPYFPKTAPNAPAAYRGKSTHFSGRNRLFLDLHVRFLRDHRTDL